MAGVYLAETLNIFLRDNWKSFAGQNYFDPRRLVLSVLWSGPLLVIAILILVSICNHSLNTLLLALYFLMLTFYPSALFP